MRKIIKIVEEIEPIDKKLMEQAQRRLDNLTKPKGSLGRIEELARRIVGITGKLEPCLEKKVIFVMTGDHGVTEEEVSAYPMEVTSQMVYNFLQGRAAINVLAENVKAKVIVVDMGIAKNLKSHPDLIVRKIGYGTNNISKCPAMDKEEAAKAVTAGIEVFEEELKRSGIDIMGTGDMGIGNTTASSAIVACITKSRVEEVAGRGTGINDEALQKKIEVIERALRINHPDSENPIDVLSKIGGYEIAGLAGCILAAARYRVPVVLDGFISTAAALISIKFSLKVKEYLISSHNSVEKGHKIALSYLNQKPLFDLSMRLGEGTGAALGIGLADISTKILTQMATFKEAKVSREKSRIRGLED